MLRKISIVFLSLFFGGALSFFVLNEDQYFKVLYFLTGLNLLLVWPIAKRLRFLAIPFFLSLGSLNLLYLIDGIYEREIFIILATVVYGMALWGANRLKKYDCDQTAQGMVNLATIVTIFFWFVSNYGWYLNFAISSSVLVIVMILSTFFIIFPSLTISFVACYKVYFRQESRVKKKKKTNNFKNKKEFILAFKQQLKIQRVALFFSFIISLIMGEIIWSLSFWPFGYLVTGMTAVIILFLFWSIVRKFIKKELTKKFILVNVFIMVATIIVMTLTSPWNVV